MSTVTPSTSNIERSTNFISKNAQAKNQASNPIASAFAALMMSVEDIEAPASTDASTQLTDNGRDSTAIDQDISPKSPGDIGQAALMGLLNWQALAASEKSDQVATGNVASPDGTAPNFLVNLPTAQTDPSKLSKWALDGSTGNAPAINASPFAQGSAIASSQATVPIPAGLGPEQLPGATSGSTPGIDVSGMSPTVGSAATESVSMAASASPYSHIEALASGVDRTSVAKARMGTSRNQLPTGAPITKTGAGTTLQSLASSGKAPETDVQPRATVDLVARAATEVATKTTEDNVPANDNASIKQDGLRLAAQTGTPGAEQMQTVDHTPDAPLQTETAPLTGMDQNELTDIMDNLSGQIAYWAAQGSQRASLTVGSDKDNPLEVNISMRDGEVHVAFEAAEAEVRDALTLSAENLLKTMLESKGMTLGDVTVGERQSSAGHGDTAPENRQGSDLAVRSRTASSSRRDTPAETVDLLEQPHRRSAIATATKLDLFA